MVTSDLVEEAIESHSKVHLSDILVSRDGLDYPWDPAAAGIPPGLPHPYAFRGYTGKDIREWRKRSGLLVTHCAKIARINPDCWHNYENGKSKVPAQFFMILFYIETLKYYFFVRKGSKKRDRH